MLPSPVVPALPYGVSACAPLTAQKPGPYRRYDPDATLQNIAPCPLTKSDYDRLRLMVDKQVLNQLPVTDARMVEVDLPACMTDTYLPLPEPFVPRQTRPWIRHSTELRSESLPSLRRKLSSSVRVNPVFMSDVLMEMLPTTIFCSAVWLYLFHLLGVKSPALVAVYRLLHMSA